MISLVPELRDNFKSKLLKFRSGWHAALNTVSECEIPHDLVIFAFDRGSVLNYVFSITVNLIYRKWLI